VTIRTRKLVGTFALLLLVFVWVFLGLALAPLAFSTSYAAVPIAFYAVAGLGWLVFAMPLVSWMLRPDKTA
jgi:hypothetical protein